MTIIVEGDTLIETTQVVRRIKKSVLEDEKVQLQAQITKINDLLANFD